MLKRRLVYIKFQEAFKNQIKIEPRLLKELSECPLPFFMSGYSQISNDYCDMMPDNVAAIKFFCLKCSKIAGKILRKQENSKEKPRENQEETKRNPRETQAKPKA